MAAQGFPDVGRKVGAFNQGQWVSIFDDRLDDGYIADLDITGLGSRIFDGLQMAKHTMPVYTRTPKVFQKLEWERNVKIGSSIATGAAGDPITIVVDPDDVDSNGNVPIQVGDGILIPVQYQAGAIDTDRVYVITDYNSGTKTATAEPLSADGNTVTASQIGTLIPADTVLSITSNYYGYGTGQPQGNTVVRSQLEYFGQISKTSLNIEGGANALKWREVGLTDGQVGLMYEGQEYTELDHNKAIDGALIVSEENDNTALTATSNAGGSSKISATKGIWNWGKEQGQDMFYSGSWNMSNFYDYKDLALTNNIVSREVNFMMGTDLQRSVELANLDWVREYSGGSDLFQAMDKLGVDVKYVNVNGFLFRLQEMASFANPQRFGNKNYDWTKRGIMMPTGNEMVNYEGKDEKHPNWMVGYLNNHGVDRTRIVRHVDGMSGTTERAVTDSDEFNVYMLSEFFNFVWRPNQIVTVEPE